MTRTNVLIGQSLALVQTPMPMEAPLHTSETPWGRDKNEHHSHQQVVGKRYLADVSGDESTLSAQDHKLEQFLVTFAVLQRLSSKNWLSKETHDTQVIHILPISFQYYCVLIGQSCCMKCCYWWCGHTSFCQISSAWDNEPVTTSSLGGRHKTYLILPRSRWLKVNVYWMMWNNRILSCKILNRQE